MLPVGFFQFLVIFFFYSLFLGINIGFFKLFVLSSSKPLLLRIIISPIFIFCSVMTFLSHYFCLTTDNTSTSSINDPLATYCNKCRCNRPQRAHHCQVCDRCILKMDHHCPWVGNCVGQNNYKSFILFLAYTVLSCSISFTFTFGDFIFYLMNKTKKHDYSFTLLPYWNRIFTEIYEVLPLSNFLSCSFGGLAAFCLLLYQLDNLSVNLTTIETKIYSSNFKECPYYCNDFKQNFKNLFGDNIVDILNPFTKNEDENEANANYIAMK